MKSHRAVVLLNLCFALIVANIVFVAGVDKTRPTVHTAGWAVFTFTRYSHWPTWFTFQLRKGRRSRGWGPWRPRRGQSTP